MDFNKISYTPLSYHYLLSYLLWRTHLTVCAQCNVIVTSEFVYIRDEFDQRIIDKAIKEWRTRLRACVEAKGGHFEHKL